MGVSCRSRPCVSRSCAANFGRQLSALATQTGIYQDEKTMDTEEVVVIGDGAAWIWNLADEHFPGATEIVDSMHAKTHLYDIAKQALGEDNPEKLGALPPKHRWTVAERCKQAGMRWGTPGINAILFWRCLLKNDVSGTYWEAQAMQNAA